MSPNIAAKRQKIDFLKLINQIDFVIELFLRIR